ncbi:MAG: DUF1570 domain-containing protein [Planctomycetota bacterium]
MRNFAAAAIVVSCAWIAGCATSLRDRLTLPGRFAVSQHDLLVHSDFPLPPRHRLFDDLQLLRADLARALNLPEMGEPIHIYVFESPERFSAFVNLHHPSFPERRAFFVETDTRLMVYAQWGDRLAEDLRHEATHAYLHAVVPAIPLWLDEGLAEYYEVPRSATGINVPHLERLASRIRAGAWQPDLRRLESIPPDAELSQDDYAECWAWIHFLLDEAATRGQIVQAYLDELRRTGRAREVASQVESADPHATEALVEHVLQLALQHRAMGFRGRSLRGGGEGGRGRAPIAAAFSAGPVFRGRPRE